MKSKRVSGSEDNKADRLEEKLNLLLKRQDEFQKEIIQLREEIYRLKKPDESIPQKHNKTFSEKSLSSELLPPETHAISGYLSDSLPGGSKENQAPIKSNIEKFIGENLANKIGIIITVIGVSIGVKYAIDHQLISPLVRIILGYILGFILLGLALNLRQNFGNYSSVLFSGSMAIMYFITFAAYDFYGLIPRVFSYALMIVFTILTVYSAISYNKQVVAHIGLVGSYAIPFLLNAGFDNIEFLFGYMAIINAGILVIAFIRNWKSLFVSAFIITWMIYGVWFASDFSFPGNFNISMLFLSINFILFYIIFLAYKLLKNEKFDAADVIILLANSSIYFGLGFRILRNHQIGIDYPGFYAVLNAVIHFGISVLIYAKKLADRSLMYFVAGLALVFITIAIPIQFNGQWVTLLWTGEALALYWIGSARDSQFYRYLAFPLMVLAFISLVHDWSMVYDRFYAAENNLKMIPFMNINFLTSLIFISAFSVINYYHFALPFSEQGKFSNLVRIFNFLIPAILIIAAYYSVRLEIAEYLNRLLQKSTDYAASINYLADLRTFKGIWLLNYSLLFVSALSLFNYYIAKNRKMLRVNVLLNIFFILVFLVSGLYALSELRESYLDLHLSEGYKPGSFHLIIRYVVYLFAAFTLYMTILIIKTFSFNEKKKNSFELALYLLIIWVASSELIHWMDILNSGQSYKFGLSILWGVYALTIVSLGIIKRKKHLRVGAIVLFGATLVKLFFYDISHLRLLPKSLIFILLGALLLIISFLYNKYTKYIFDESENIQNPSE